jgi:hypothetical protein
MSKMKELKIFAGVDNNPDQEGLDLFATMIINECVDTVRRHVLKSTGITEPYDGKVIACEIIKEHFSK